MRQSRGLVLLAVLWVNVVLILMAALLRTTARLQTAGRVQAVQQIQCEWAARAGVELAVARLNEDTAASDALTELWCDNDSDYNDLVVGACRVDVRVVDEAAKLNLNVVSRDQLLALPGMTVEVADAVLDWRDRDDTVREQGAESGYYESLDIPYPIRNGPFQSVQELLLVKAVTPELFYGEDTNHNGRLDPAEQDGEQTPPLDDGDAELDLGWGDLLTCWSYCPNTDAEGRDRVNVNQADEGTLQQQLGLRPGQARWIVERRGRDGFKSLGDLIDRDSPAQPPDAPTGPGRQSEPMDRQTFRAIVDRLTLVNDPVLVGQVNVNTAGRTVLEALFHESDRPRALAQAVIEARSQRLAGFSSVGDLLAIEGLDVDTFKRIVDQVTVRSAVFRVWSRARSRRSGLGATAVMTTAVVDRRMRPASFLTFYEGVCEP